MQYAIYAFTIEMLPESEEERRLAISIYGVKENARTVSVPAASDAERDAVKKRFKDAMDARKG